MIQAIVSRATMNESDFGDGNGHEIEPRRTAMVEVAASRAAQEVQAMMIIAKRFPRDETSAYARIMKACKRKGLAEQAIYEYPRGGTRVTGPSIRLAEALAQAWGNVDSGVIELEQRSGESSVMAFCLDLETNSRQSKVFTVPHERHTKTGVTQLTDPRDIYELVANQGARRLRACILGVIPGDVVDAAVNECNKTMRSGSSEPLADRVRSMLVAFADLAVTQDMIEARLGHNLDSTSEHELAGLRRVYQSIRDGMAGREQFFSKSKTGTDSKLEDTPDPKPKPQNVRPANDSTDGSEGSLGAPVASAPSPPLQADANQDGATHAVPAAPATSEPSEESVGMSDDEKAQVEFTEWMEACDAAAAEWPIPRAEVAKQISALLAAKGLRETPWQLALEVRTRTLADITNRTGLFAVAKRRGA